MTEPAPVSYESHLSLKSFAYGNRKLSFRREGVFFSLTIIGVGIAAINTGINLLYLLMAMSCSLLLLSGILSEYCLKGLRLQVSFPEVLFAEKPFTPTITLYNGKKRLPSFSLQLRIPVAGTGKHDTLTVEQIEPQGAWKKTVLWKAEKRGVFRLPPAECFTCFPFSFFTKSRLLALNQEVSIYPPLLPEEQILSITGELLFSSQTETKTLRSSRGDFHGNRTYNTGDSMRDINWRASARTGSDTLISKEFSHEQGGVFSLRFNEFAQVSEQVFEKEVSLAASFCYHLYHKGWTIHFKTALKDFPPIRDTQGLYAVLATLADIRQLKPEEELSQQPDKNNNTAVLHYSLLP